MLNSSNSTNISAPTFIMTCGAHLSVSHPFLFVHLSVSASFLFVQPRSHRSLSTSLLKINRTAYVLQSSSISLQINYPLLKSSSISLQSQLSDHQIHQSNLRQACLIVLKEIPWNTVCGELVLQLGDALPCKGVGEGTGIDGGWSQGCARSASAAATTDLS